MLWFAPIVVLEIVLIPIVRLRIYKDKKKNAQEKMFLSLFIYLPFEYPFWMGVCVYFFFVLGIFFFSVQ